MLVQLIYTGYEKEKKKKKQQILQSVKYSKDVMYLLMVNKKAQNNFWRKKIKIYNLIYNLNVCVLDKISFNLYLLKREIKFRFNPQKREFK